VTLSTKSTMLRGSSIRWPVAAALLSMGSAAFADLPRDFCPRKDGTVDPATAVDKDALAASLLDANKVPRRFEPRVAPLRKNFPDLAALSDRAFLLVQGRDVCKDLGCSKAEAKSLAGAAQALVRIGLTAQPGFAVSSRVARRDEFFLRSDVTLRCIAMPGDADKPTGPDAASGRAEPEPFSLAHVRVRGTPSDLLVAPGYAGYDDASKAKLSYEDDRVAKTRSTQLTGAVGYALRLGEWSSIRADRPSETSLLRAIPYAAFDIETSRTTGQPRADKSNQFDTGALIELLWSRVTPVPSRIEGTDTEYVHQDNYLAVTPHYRIDYKDHSAILGVNFLYRPYVMNGFNSPVALGLGVNGYFLGDVRFNNGHFTSIGTRDPAASGDFSRFGGRLGFYVGSSDGFPIPFDLTVAGIYMRALAGQPGHLSQLKAELGIYFTRKKNLGVDFAYSRGRAEDLDDRERKFTFGLGIKF